MFPRTSSKSPASRPAFSLLIVSAILLNWLSPAIRPFNSVSLAAPAPVAAPQAAPTESVRQISLASRDIIYDPQRQLIYASVPGTAGSIGNSITAIDPQTNTIGASVFIGSEPGKLAISDNSQYVYAALDGSAAVGRYDIAAQTAGLLFRVGRDSQLGPYYVSDLDVLPGDANAVAVSRKYGPFISAGAPTTVIYDNGVPRPNSVYVGKSIEFSASAATLYGGTDGTFTKAEVNANGISQVSQVLSGSFAGADLKYDNGLLYTELGKVIDPEAKTVVGTYPGMSFDSLVEPNSKVGRVFFLTRNPIPETVNGVSVYTWTLRAFNQTTFQPVGTLEIKGINGIPSSLIRWGTNGLAFRTSSNQLFIIQTTLVSPSAPIPDPVPTPQPTPTPAPAGLILRTIPLPANDIVLDESTQTIYASIASRAGQNGNSITAVDPLTASIKSSTFIGSEPTKLALAGDGHSLYAALDGAAAVRRFDIATQTPGLQFSLGSSQSGIPLVADDLAVLPDNPDAVAVSRRNSGYNVAVYDNGVQRPVVSGELGNRQYLEFSTNSSVLYGGDGSLVNKMTVDASGVKSVGSMRFHSRGDIKFKDNLLYVSSGAVINPETGDIIGTYADPDLTSGSVLLIDAPKNLIYFLSPNETALLRLRVFELSTFREIGAVELGFHGGAKNLVRWGENGLAFSNGFEIVILQTSLIPSSQPFPTATPTPTPTPAPTPTPVATALRRFNLATNDLVYDRNTQMIYASIPSFAVSIGNTITQVNPRTGLLGSSTPIGDEPSKLAITDNGQYIYVGLNGATRGVRRFDVASGTAGLQFQLGGGDCGPQYTAFDMEVLPGSTDSVAVSRLRGCSPSFGGTVIYDNGVRRTNAMPEHTGPYNIAFSSSASTLYGTGDDTFYKMAVDSSGIKLSSKRSSFAFGDIKFDNGLLYSPDGRVVDPEAGTVIGTYSFNSNGSGDIGFLVAPDSSAGRVYFITGNPLKLRVFDQQTFIELGVIPLPAASGNVSSLIRWGANGLAFRTSTNQLFIIQTDLIPSAEAVPSILQFSAPTFNTSEGAGQATVTVSRTGGTNNACSVDYSTSSGTATLDVDYKAVSGTLNFAPGEASKTISVPLIDDSLDELTKT
ncbi:MAG: hypothetical protein ICV60_22165, partial [Pyrinomonadaceae bacterium]|nr:hypothetical protein [Pyrinomonadaceae bacterium]